MYARIAVLRLEGGKKKTFEAKSDPYYSSESAVDRAVSGHKVGNHPEQGTAWGSKPACSLFTYFRAAGLLEWRLGYRSRHQGRALQRQAALCASGIVPLPIREKSVLTCLCSVHGAAKSCLACTDQDLPAGSAHRLLVNSGKTLNHRKSDTEIATHTRRHK